MTMNKPKRAEEHTSKELESLLAEITPQEQTRSDQRMMLAVKIDDARKAKGWSQTEFAEVMGQQPSVISKWLSGTNNFTTSTLWDIEEKLGVELIALKEREWRVTKVVEYNIVVHSVPSPIFGYVQSYLRTGGLAPTFANTLLESKTYKYG
jgi:transcriptional regulator with XRE-family HTH domain